MNILLFLIPVSMAALILAAWAFIWAVKRGQFEDLDTPALDILREDEHDRPLRDPAPRPSPAVAAGAADKPAAPAAGDAAAAPDPSRGGRGG